MDNSSLRPIRSNKFDYWKAQHLLNRAGFGGTPAQARALADMGLNKAVDHIVEYDSVPTAPVSPDEFDGAIMRPQSPQERQAYQRARRNGDEAAVEQFRIERQKRQGADRRQIREIKNWWLRRMIESPRPLEEKMTLFWHGHFATGYRTIENSYDMFQQNQFFRSNATGNFAELVYGVVRDPATLRYLNNNQNNRRAPNENLARELMELFVLGEGHDYTENDIKEGARALTGFTYQYNTAQDRNAFFFNASNHDPTPKRILGKVGQWDGIDFCRIILQRTVASEFICQKLYRFFVNDLPGRQPKSTDEFVSGMAKLLRDSNYELKPVFSAVFKSAHFYETINTASLIKNPIQLAVQAIRSLHTPHRDIDALVNACDLMGQNILEPPSVKGWDGGRAWINTSTLFVRQNLLIYLLTGKRPNVYDWQQNTDDYDAMHVVNHLRNGNGEIRSEDAVKYLLRFNLGTEPEHERVQALTRFVDEQGGMMTNDMVVALLALITAMPEYQLH